MRHDYSVFRRKGTKTWYFYYYDDDGKRKARSTGKTVKYKAEDEAEKFLDNLNNPRCRLKLKDFAKDFFEWDRCTWIKKQHAKGRPFTLAVADSRHGHLVNHILPAFGEKPLPRITKADVENWLLEEPFANQTKNHILYTFRIIMKEAAAAGHIEVSPLKETEPFGKTSRPRDTFTMEEYRRLFPTDSTELIRIWGNTRTSALFMILASAGLRSGEVRALRWSAVLDDYSALLVAEAVKPDRYNSIADTKTGAWRAVPLPKRTGEILRLWHGETVYPEKECLVFFAGRDYDKPLNRKTLCHQLAQALQRAEVDPGDRQLVPHSFRHYYNTTLRNLMPEPLLRQLTGHKTEKMTGRYDHPQVKDLLQRVEPARAIVEEVWK